MDANTTSQLLSLLVDGNPIAIISAIIIVITIFIPFIIRHLGKLKAENDVDMLGIKSGKNIIVTLNEEIERQNQTIDRLNKNINTLNLALDLSNNSLSEVTMGMRNYEYELKVAQLKIRELVDEIERIKHNNME